MVLRNTRPDLPRFRQQPPRSRRSTRLVPLCIAAVAVLAVAVFVGVHALGSSPSSSSPATTVSIPPAPAQSGSGPLAGAKYAGQSVLDATGSELTSWNQTKSYCAQDSWQVGDGSVSANSDGAAVLATTGKTGSCVALVSPKQYSSALIEADVYFPALPGHSGTIADWSSVWLVNQSDWPQDGELDAVEAEPLTGVNAVSYHYGSSGAEQSVSTDGLAADGTLPKDGPNLTPGWHVVDIAYTSGFFSVWYDGKLFTSAQNGAITGAPLNLLVTTSVTADTSAVKSAIGGSPKNSDSQPAGLGVKYIKVWSFK